MLRQRQTNIDFEMDIVVKLRQWQPAIDFKKMYYYTSERLRMGLI